ncbi:MAG: hypothetical protein ACPL4K_04375, partial [Candidatus Margulisiibacteriota bacterium]
NFVAESAKVLFSNNTPTEVTAKMIVRDLIYVLKHNTDQNTNNLTSNFKSEIVSAILAQMPRLRFPIF